jgi:hypothetical protein
MLRQAEDPLDKVRNHRLSETKKEVDHLRIGDRLSAMVLKVTNDAFEQVMDSLDSYLSTDLEAHGLDPKQGKGKEFRNNLLEQVTHYFNHLLTT